MKQIIIFINTDERTWLEYSTVAAAAKRLNGGALKLFLYLHYQERGSEVPFSPKLVVQDFGGGFTTISRAFEELEKNGYITLKEKDYYIFNDRVTILDDFMDKKSDF